MGTLRLDINKNKTQITITIDCSLYFSTNIFWRLLHIKISLHGAQLISANSIIPALFSNICRTFPDPIHRRERISDRRQNLTPIVTTPVHFIIKHVSRAIMIPGVIVHRITSRSPGAARTSQTAFFFLRSQKCRPHSAVMAAIVYYCHL